MKPHQRLFRRSLVAVLVASAAGLASFSVGTAQASTEYHYCFGTVFSGLGDCRGDRHTLINNQAITDWGNTVCVYVKQANPPYWQTGLVCGVQNTSQAYCGCELVYPHLQGGSGTYYGFGRY